MRRNTLLVSLAAVTIAVAAGGCAQKPVDEITAATQALDQARAEGAGDYAPEAWAAAQEADAQLRAELAAQDRKFALFRSYGNAKALAADVKGKAERALQDAAAAKARMKEEATKLIADARAALADLQRALQHAPTGKGAQADLAAMRADADGVEATVAEADTALGAGDYKTAKAKAESALATIERIKGEIVQAEEARRRAGRV